MKEIKKIIYLKNGVYKIIYKDKTHQKVLDLAIRKQPEKEVKKGFKKINKMLFVLGTKKTMEHLEYRLVNGIGL